MSETKETKNKKTMSTFQKKRGTFYFDLKYDKNKGMDTLMAYRKNPPKEDGKASSLVILASLESKNYPMMSPKEWWEVEYYESDERPYAQATPLQRAKLVHEVVQKDPNGPMGYRLSAAGAADNENAMIFMKVFPKNRKYTKFIEDVILAKIEKRGYQAYKEDILEGFKNTLHELALAETTASEIIGETMSYIKDMDAEEYGGETQRVTELFILNKINERVEIKIGDMPDSGILAAEIVQEFGILEYHPHQTQFTVKRIAKEAAKANV